MEVQDFKASLSGVEETLVFPLWARAKDAERDDPVLGDSLARDIVTGIDYDFSKIETKYMQNHQLVWVIRALNFDTGIRKFLAKYGSAVVINIGAGLDTTFLRVDNGSVQWVNIDLPAVAELRQRLIPDSERETTVAKSVFDFTWMDDVAPIMKGHPVFFMAAGVLCYFEPSEVKALFRKLANVYSGAHFIFDAMTRFTVWISNRAVLKGTGVGSSTLVKWHIRKASHLNKWVDTLKVIEEYPMFARVPLKEDWSRKLIRDIRIAGRLHIYNMAHVQL